MLIVKQALKQGFALEFMSGTYGFCYQYAAISKQIFVTPSAEGVELRFAC